MKKKWECLKKNLLLWKLRYRIIINSKANDEQFLMQNTFMGKSDLYYVRIASKICKQTLHFNDSSLAILKI